ncbi:MAG: T9SS type A sorting domain-containing protein [Melioribacter sp.]|nr:T9SS type A sorting domain-containing protein [Melioribacter sp.]
MKNVSLIILMILGLGSLSAQAFVKPYNSGFNPDRSELSNDTLKILAIMVDFQEDKYDATIGTGKFGSHFTQDYRDTILDPLPHNANYFSDHLLFAKNYYQKVSRGKLNLSYKVLPDVITVSKTMRDYVPAYQSRDFTPIANFASEVWKLADEKYSDIKFSDYNLFIIFHAGVSSGLDLGTFSIDRNLPSLYLGLNTFKKVYGNQFTGIPTRSGKIVNSIILPETESREQTAIDNSIFLQQITINGELVNNIGNYLGLPDLYDTETGLSAIGRFGLMDGQAISANNGMFPPEPSAWEKMFLGWEQPTKLSINNSHPSITARLTALVQDTTLLKIPINSSEYFLVENRQQDANKDRVKITYKKNGETFNTIIQPDTSGLYSITPDKIDGGVVIDVDEFDAAVPGNGIVIWHIDEKIINEKIAENKINSDPNARGVYVEEADGIFDIGKRFNTIFGIAIGEGTNEDFWYAGNKAKLFKNRFAQDTKPNTKSTNGSNSLITMENFTAISNKMSFSINYGSTNLNLVSSSNLNLTSGQKYLSAAVFAGKNYVYVTDDKTTYVYDYFGKELSRLTNFSSTAPAVIDLNGQNRFIGTDGNIVKLRGGTEADIQLSSPISAAALIDQNGNNAKAYVGTSDGTLYVSNNLADGFSNFNFTVASKIINEPIKHISAAPNYYSYITQNYFVDANQLQIHLSNPSMKLISTQSRDLNPISIVLTEKNGFDIIANSKLQKSFVVNSSVSINNFSVADLFNDGQNYILLTNGNSIDAYNLEGVMAKNFPFKIKTGENFVGAPLAVDLNKQGYASVIAVTDAGNIFAVNPSTGNLVEGFPISSGAKSSTASVILSEELPTMGPLPSYKPVLILLDDTNKLYVWNIAPIQGKTFWSGEFGSALNSSFVSAPSLTQQVTDFFPLSKAYNWPNPVYGSSTNIRYYVSEDSDVRIKIVDLAGELVAELNNKARGGFDNETVWDVSKIQSGVYYAYLEVTGSNGNLANKIIKIAVVK